MPAKVAIALVDSPSTPESPGTPGAATRTFQPGAVENGNVHTFYEGTTGTTMATKSKATLSLKPASSASPVSRVKMSMALPKAQVVDGITKVAHITRANVEFILPQDCTRDDRRDIRTLIANLINSAEGAALVADNDDLW